MPRRTLSRRGRAVGSVFDLLGRNENDLTAAVGFALSRSPLILAALVQRVLGGEPSKRARPDEARDDLGRTDLEVDVGLDTTTAPRCGRVARSPRSKPRDSRCCRSPAIAPSRWPGTASLTDRLSETGTRRSRH